MKNIVSKYKEIIISKENAMYLLEKMKWDVEL